jgi:hypothetical protein
MSPYFYWPFFILVPFLLPEAVFWLDRKPGGTFSDWLWDVWALRRGTHQQYARLRRLTFGAFWAALSGHIFLQTSAVWVFGLAAANVWSVVYHYRHEKPLVQYRQYIRRLRSKIP